MKHFRHFISFTDSDYEVNWHHRAIAEKLNDFAHGKIQRLILTVPPQHGKSELSCRKLPAYLLGLNPDRKIGVCSYAADLAQGFNRSCQLIMDTPEYGTLFPGSALPQMGDVEQRNTHRFDIRGANGYYKAVGVGGSLTGTPLDVGIVDDSYKGRIEAESETIRYNTQEWFDNVFLTRFKDAGQVLILMTRWHQDDLIGRLLDTEPERWEVINFPALKVGPPTEADPREDGEALWPKWHSREKLLQVKEKNSRTFNSLYQQNPIPEEGNIFKQDWFEVVSEETYLARRKRSREPVFFTADTAYTEKTVNDPTALMGAQIIDNDLYLLEVRSKHLEMPDLLDWIPEFTKRNYYTPSSVIHVEGKASGLSVVQSLKRSSRLNIKAFKWPKVNRQRIDDKDKITRAYSIQGFCESGRVKLVEGNWNDSFLTQLRGFPNASHDDEVDCLIMSAVHAFLRKDAGGFSQGN